MTNAIEARRLRDWYGGEIAHQQTMEAELHQASDLVALQLGILESMAIGRADPYYIAGPIVELLNSAAVALPRDTVYQPTLPFTPSGFAQLGATLNVRDEFIVQAVAWRVLDDGRCIVAQLGQRPGRDAPPWSFYEIIWEPGQTLAEAAAAAKVDPAHPALTLTTTLWTFCRQEILMDAPAPLSRQQRRQCVRQHEPLPREIILRRTRRKDGETAGEERGRLTMQHVVSGHWKSVWCGPLPKAQQWKEPRWIMPYIQGPPGSPLRAQGERLFSVSR